MMKQLLFVLMLVSSLAFACDSNIYNVSMPMTLDLPNHVYCMVEDVDANNTGGNAFDVVETNITIDCQGWTITGDGTGNGVYSDQNRTRVESCNIGSFETGIVTFGNSGSIANTTTNSSIYMCSSYNTLSNISASNDGSTNNFVLSVNTIVGEGTCYSLNNTFNHLTLTGTGGANALDMELGGNDGYNVFGNSTMTSDIEAAIYLSEANSNTFENISAKSNEASAIYISLSTNNHITNSIITSTLSNGFGFNTDVHNNTASNNTIVAGNLCFDLTGSGGMFFGNNCTSDLWVSDSSVGGNTFNGSTSGNIWNFANGTPSWAVYATAVVGAPGWATSGTVPFNATNTPTEWSGVSGDFHPWTGNEYVTPPIPPPTINVNYTNYSTPNVTGFGGAFDYSKTVMTTATGWADAFGLMVLGTIFLCFYIIGSRYSQERALVYTMFMTVVVAFLMVSGNFLDPKWLILSIVGLLASVYFAGRVSQ
jgi:hypothetical protein